MITTAPTLGRRRTAALIAIALAASLFYTLTTPATANAATLNLGPSSANTSKSYYTTPRVKPATGTATIKVTSNTETCGGGGRVNVGMRTTLSAGESTQFPSVAVNQTVGFRNIGAPPAQNTIFAAGTYYFNAQIGCNPGGTWTGIVTW